MPAASRSAASSQKLAFAWRERTIKFFTTSAIDDDSRVIIRNNIVDRVEAAAPFLALDADPYMVIADKRLYWIQDAYTTTDRYPYATPEGDLNYIRNSVKVVIDAYNGTMRFYVFDEDDPLLRTYREIFPDLFTPSDEIPQALFDHIRYPEGQFMTQARVFETYHVSDPDVLYNKGDQWQIPENVSLEDNGSMSAFYVIMRLPGAEKEQFLLILPFTPNTRPNMISWLGAQSDGAAYGESVVYQFSESTTVFGPAQVEAAINQDPTISAQRSLWDQQGSRVILGNLIIVPIEDSLLYVQPLYLVGEQTQLPQLKRVIVFYRMPGASGSESDAEQTRRHGADPGRGAAERVRRGAADRAARHGRRHGRHGRRHGRRYGDRGRRRRRRPERPRPRAHPAGERAVRGRAGGAAGRRLGRVRAPDRRCCSAR